MISGFGWVCAPPSNQDAVTVKDGRFNYTFVDQLAQPAPIAVQIAADGTLRGQTQYGTESAMRFSGFIVVWATVTGRINGTALEATVADYRCTRQLMLQKALSPLPRTNRWSAGTVSPCSSCSMPGR